MVAGVAQAWVRSGHLAPLEQRWDEAVARLQKLNPGATVGGPRSELALDAITEEIARLTRPPPEPDAAIKAACEELGSLRQRYHRNWMRVRELQLQLRRPASDPVHEILQDIPSDWAEDVGPPIEMGWSGGFRTAREARAAVAELLPRVLRLEGRAAQLVAALNTSAAPDEAVNRRLILKIWEKIEQLSRAPPATNIPARARAEAAIAADPSRSDRAIADELGIGKDSVRRARNLLARHAPTNQRKAS
jgi:hypothetical protein